MARHCRTGFKALDHGQVLLTGFKAASWPGTANRV